MILTVTGNNEKGPLLASIIASMGILENHEWAMRSCEYRRNISTAVVAHLENYYWKLCYSLVRLFSSRATGKKFTEIGD